MSNPIPTLRIRCAICDKPVDRVTVMPGVYRSAFTIEAECHGETDRMEVTQIDAINLGPDGIKQLQKQEGIAFLNAKLEQAWAEYVGKPVSEELRREISAKMLAIAAGLGGGGDGG